jgi:dTDP-glucose 4,6-dehydratase
MRVLVTGGAGFIGSHVIEYILNNEPTAQVVSLDRLDVSGTLNRLADVIENTGRKVEIVWHDLKAPISDLVAAHLANPDIILHLAASSHVDRSIIHPSTFVMDNVLGTCHLLEYACKIKPKLVMYFSTDEVFGSAPKGILHKEWDRYKSSNPYSASKAGGEELAVAFANTYDLPVIITHTMNVFGHRQHPEKYLPLCISKILNDETVTVHADLKRGKPGSRFYVHAGDVADATWTLVRNHLDGNLRVNGDKFNIVGGTELDNLELPQLLAQYLGKPLKYDLVDFGQHRPGCDLRYGLDGSKMREWFHWEPQNIGTRIAETTAWYLNHPAWLTRGTING